MEEDFINQQTEGIGAGIWTVLIILTILGSIALLFLSL